MEDGQIKSEWIDIHGLAEVLEVKDAKRASYIARSNEDFPKPAVLGPRLRRWNKSEVSDWLKVKYDR